MRVLVINNTSDIIENIVDLDEEIQKDESRAWKVPAGCYIIRSDWQNIGEKYEG